VQTESVAHIGNRQPLRSVAEAGIATPPAQPLIYVTLGTVQRRPELLREVVAGVAGGAALMLAPPEVNQGSVRTAVERLLNDETLRTGAGRVAAEIAGMPGPDQVARVLAERFAPRVT